MNERVNMSIKDKIKRGWPYLLICMVVFYLPPIWISGLGAFVTLLLTMTPFTCFIASMLWGMRAGRDWMFPILIAAAFVPAIFIFYNSSAWVYSAMYGLFSLIGILVGDRIMKKMKA